MTERRSRSSDTGRAAVRRERLDRIGAAASSVCVVHCAACALLPAAFGTLGARFSVGHGAEWLFTLTAVGLGTGALIRGLRRHRAPGIGFLFVVGIFGLLVSRGLEGTSVHPHGERDHDRAQRSMGTELSVAPHVEGHHDEHLAGTTVGVIAGLLLVAAHVLNLRACRSCAR